MSDENDQAYEPDDAEQAFVHSDNHSLGELELEPFTPERFVCAQGMGLLWPGVVAEGPRNAILYKGQARDAVILLWTCSIPISTPKSEKKNKINESEPWSVKRALREPESAIDEAMRWAGEQGFSQPNSPAFWKAINKFTDIVLEINASYTAPVINSDQRESPPSPN